MSDQLPIIRVLKYDDGRTRFTHFNLNRIYTCRILSLQCQKLVSKLLFMFLVLDTKGIPKESFGSQKGSLYKNNAWFFPSSMASKTYHRCFVVLSIENNSTL